MQGETHYTVDSSIELFCNHGCNQTYSYGDGTSYTEMNVDLGAIPQEIQNNAKASAFCPSCERHLRQALSLGDSAMRDIKAGEEIYCNYLSFVGGSPYDWAEDVTG